MPTMNPKTPPHPDWKLPTRQASAWFLFRASGLRLLRTLSDWKSGPRRWPAAARLADAPIIARFSAPLWTDGRADEFTLVAGKVHNLRRARPAFDAIEVPAGQTFSFWRQLGRPGKRRGFVLGREVRSGCIIPTIAGGICQISNALATCAKRAGFELVERHAHSASIEQADDCGVVMDATVFWNYIDLRIRADVDWRIEMHLDARTITLAIRSHGATLPASAPAKAPREALSITLANTPATHPATRRVPAPVARGCLTCRETRCFRHAPALAGDAGRNRHEAWLLDGWTPEFAYHLAQQPTDPQRLILAPALITARQRRATGWQSQPQTTTTPQPLGARWIALRRTIWLRKHANSPGRRQASLMDGQRWLAQHHASRLRPEHCRLVVDQSLLPYLWQAGVLAGREYEVLAGSLPMDEITRRLDVAAQRWPQQASLRDFRANPELHHAEMAALRGASRFVTAHSEVAAYLSANTDVPVHLLQWVLPPPHDIARSGRPENQPATLVLACSALPRKGACELAEALREMDCRVRVLGSLAAADPLWHGIDIQAVGFDSDWLRHADAVVLPAHIEHSPRAALRAAAAGIPVVASDACGLAEVTGVVSVPAGDPARLHGAISQALRGQPSADFATAEPGDAGNSRRCETAPVSTAFHEHRP